MNPIEKQELKEQSLASTKWQWPSVHPEGRKFVVVAAAITLLFFLFISDDLGWPLFGLTLWVAAFFRDPARTTPKGEGLIIAPADGLVTMIVQTLPPQELQGADGLGNDPVTRISIFMSVFDVHINRTPIAGEIKRIAYIPGLFLNADMDKASEDNERRHVLVVGENDLHIGFTQIAGLVARRIVPWIKVGDFVSAGQRIGLIRFGSRVDVYLPAGTGPQVLVGQRTIAGETIIARAGVSGDMEGIRQ